MLDWKLLAGAAGIVAAVVFVIWLIFFCARRIREHLKGRELDAMEGHDFEYFCADLLEDHGFKSVEVTRGSGDYGVDVLAEKEGVTYAVQCKRYDGPVGVKAVQECGAGLLRPDGGRCDDEPVFYGACGQGGKEAEDSPVGQGISGKHDGRRGIRKYEFCGIS